MHYCWQTTFSVAPQSFFLIFFLPTNSFGIVGSWEDYHQAPSWCNAQCVSSVVTYQENHRTAACQILLTKPTRNQGLLSWISPLLYFFMPKDLTLIIYSPSTTFMSLMIPPLFGLYWNLASRLILQPSCCSLSLFFWRWHNDPMLVPHEHA